MATRHRQLLIWPQVWEYTGTAGMQAHFAGMSIGIIIDDEALRRIQRLDHFATEDGAIGKPPPSKPVLSNGPLKCSAPVLTAGGKGSAFPQTRFRKKWSKLHLLQVP